MINMNIQKTIDHYMASFGEDNDIRSLLTQLTTMLEQDNKEEGITRCIAFAAASHLCSEQCVQSGQQGEHQDQCQDESSSLPSWYFYDSSSTHRLHPQCAKQGQLFLCE